MDTKALVVVKDSKDHSLNKSLVTNVIAGALMVGGYVSPIYGDQILNTGLFAFSGAITNWLAIHMLFEKVPGLYGSGIIPNKFEEFKAGIHGLIMDQFFTRDNISRFLDEGASPEFHLEPVIEALDYDMLFDKLVSAIQSSPLGGMLQMFGGVEALNPLKPAITAKLKDALKELAHDAKLQGALKNALMGDLASSSIIDKVNGIVEKRLEELTPQMVKEIIQNMIRSHLGWLVVWGGVFGGLIGFIASFVS